jgi:3alpha(or 20beta)-hydroxysteroid dehydrogenase
MGGRVEGKIVVITGAAGGQGAEEARLLTAEGATVIATDVKDAAEPTPGVLYHRLDVTDPEGWKELAARIERDHGRLDVLVNNAGVSARLRIADVDLETWNAVFAVNVTGPFLGIQTLSPLMPPGSSIINIASVAALTGHYPVAYTASKWALRGLSRVASNDLGSQGIRVNTVFPGYIQTGMSGSTGAGFIEQSMREIPLARLGVTSDVAPLILYLASDESSYLSGAEIPVDGGQSAHGGTHRFLETADQAQARWGLGS